MSSRLNPLLFRLPNSVSICQRSPYTYFNPLALFVTANHQQLPVGQTGSLKIVLLPIHHHWSQSFPFTCFQRPKVAIQRLPCATFSRYLRVFLAADAVRNPCLTQIRQSFIANGLPVSIEGFDMDFGKGLTEKFRQTHSFACVGVPLFIQRFGVMDKFHAKNHCSPYAARLYARSKPLNTKNALVAA